MIKALADIHLARKITHVSGISLMVVAHAMSPLWVSWSFLILIGVPLITFDILRQNNEKLKAFTAKTFGAIMRRRELNHLSGTTYLFIGAAIILLIFPKNIVTLSLLFLAFGDPTASFFGVKYGHNKILGKKSLQGSIAAFVVCTVIAVIYFYYRNLLVDHLVVASLLAGIIGSVSELVPIFEIDDNCTQPVLNAIGLSGLFFLFGGF